MTRFTLLLATSALAHATASAQSAPAGRCKLNFESERLQTIQLPSKNVNAYMGGNVKARCPAQRVVLLSDSLEYYGDEGRYYFVGHVSYSEPRMKLKSDFLTYFQKEERLLAFQNVDATLPSGSQLKGPSLEYFRALPRVRPQQSATAIGRPTISVVERDPQGKAQPPVKVTGNTVWMSGDSVISSSGQVEVVRPELTATGDSLYLDGGKGLLRVMRNPKITGTKGRPFTLVGETLDLYTRRRKLDRVLALKAAEATSEDINLKSDTIDLRVTDDLLQRAIAWGKSRARAQSPTQTMVSDSIDVAMPGQKLKVVRAMRGAQAEGMPDTTKFKTPERDRLTGDTIIATFDSVIVRDSVKPRIKQLVAIGNATSYQHLPDRDSTCKFPAINYVKGNIITVGFDSSGVRQVEVRKDQPSEGLLVEPDSLCGRRKAPADATTRPPAAAPARPPLQAPPADAPMVALAFFNVAPRRRA